MKVPAARPFFPEQEIKNILSDIEVSLRDGSLTLGPSIKKFEQMFAGYIGVKHAIAVNSGTASLEIALRYFDVKDKEVVVPTNSFVASANAVHFAGGRPVLADIREDTLCLDPEDLKEKITDKTKGVMVVHLAGLIPPQMKEIIEICEDNKLFLMEDAAQAHGASVDGRKAGSLSGAGSFSFFPTKPMTTGEGGMITTDDSNLDAFARSLRHHGIEGRDNYPRFGYNWRMSSINAIIGIHQLDHLDSFVKERNEVAKKYTEKLSGLDGVTTIPVPSNIVHSYYKYPVILPFDTFELQKTLKEKYEIETSFLYYPPIHLQPLYQNYFGYKPGMLPVAEDVLKRMICLPMFVGITDEQISYVVEALTGEMPV
ncbi:MAG: DegT/DnrJ/EryC1/StrS family aminotransferase [Candidatus Aenigmarchaeota archaeon]|nr:DegT/DnrJ/EryC1/StrS family aminotransferase [Candidatus Aenigmarchaeota archaeon]